MLTMEEHNTLFGNQYFNGSHHVGNMESILGLHLGVLKGLHSRLIKWDDNQTIADVFVDDHTSVSNSGPSCINQNSVQLLQAL
jgi:hypothetical protein